MEVNDSFDAVYYSHPIPTSFHSLTLLSLVFDKIYFPGVYISEDLDIQVIKEEIKRLQSLSRNDYDTNFIINCHIFSIYKQYLNNFCVFTGKFGSPGILEKGAKDLTKILEELIYGPPPPNFIPTYPMGFAHMTMNGPSWLSYPANALIFSKTNEIPLINDNPNLPIPGLGGANPKSNAKILSTILAIECINFVLPNLRPLKPDEIVEFREQTIEYVKPFRMTMLKLSKELNSMITSEMDIEGIQKEARFLIETTVYPELEELKQVIQDPAKPWHKRAISLAKSTPELVTNFLTMPKTFASLKLFSKLITELFGITEEEIDKKGKIKRSGLTYLLRLKEKIG